MTTQYRTIQSILLKAGIRSRDDVETMRSYYYGIEGAQNIGPIRARLIENALNAPFSDWPDYFPQIPLTDRKKGLAYLTQLGEEMGDYD